MTIAAVIPLLFLIAGYGFMANWQLAQWYTARQAGHRLYLRITLYGMLMFIIACLVFTIYWPADIHSFYTAYDEHKQNHPEKPFDYSPYAILLIKIQLVSILCGVLGGHVLTQLMGISLFKGINVRLLKNALKDNDFELLLMRSMQSIIPVLFTCQSGKVYVGLVNRSEEPQNIRTHIRILPLLSGFRDIETLRVEFTTNYHDVYMKLGIGTDGIAMEAINEPHPYLVLKDFELVLPFKNIQSANLFDINTFLLFEEQHEVVDKDE